MKVPDKIYLPVIEVDGEMLICTNWGEKDISNDAYIKETIPYIRKDTILEWLKGYNHPITRIIVKKIINKINSM